MKKLLFISSIIIFLQSCVFTRMDDSVDLGGNYRFIQDYPQTIIFHRTLKYEGVGVNIVSPVVLSYKFNNRYIIAKSKDLEDGEMKFWIVDKIQEGTPVEPLDSLKFSHMLEELNITLGF